MLHSDVLQLLTPLELGATHQTDLVIEGQHLDVNAISADRLLVNTFPDSTDDIVAWERVLGIAPAADATLSERLAEIISRLRSLGRLDRQFFIDIAATVGYALTIDELAPLMAGWAESGDNVMAEIVRWIWQVTIIDGFSRFAQAGLAAAGEPLAWFRDKRHLDYIFNDLKPAHTMVVFA